MGESAQLKDWFNEARYRQLATDLAAVCPAADPERFLALTLDGLDERSLMQRLRRTAEAFREVLPTPYPRALAVLHRLAPRLDHGFVGIVLADFVGQFGHDHFDESMAALRVFTRHGSAEFAIREFLRRDLPRTLRVMEGWSRDTDEHVRRLASEGCRPRLPWSFKLDALIADPQPVGPILDNLRADPSAYVRKSVANHLNDISKDQPDWLFDRFSRWNLEDVRTAWIARHALRTLIKRGDPRALSVIGAGRRAEVRNVRFAVAPAVVKLGGRLTLKLAFASSARADQMLVVDYAIHYVKASGQTSRKVFKWKTGTVATGESVTWQREQRLQDFTTRTHYPGVHRVEVMFNGQALAESRFELVR